MDENPVPILIVSSLYENSNIRLAMEVLEAGAVAIIPKPNGSWSSALNLMLRAILGIWKRMSEVCYQKNQAKDQNN